MQGGTPLILGRGGGEVAGGRASVAVPTCMARADDIRKRTAGYPDVLYLPCLLPFACLPCLAELSLALWILCFSTLWIYLEWI